MLNIQDSLVLFVAIYIILSVGFFFSPDADMVVLLPFFRKYSFYLPLPVLVLNLHSFAINFAPYIGMQGPCLWKLLSVQGFWSSLAHSSLASSNFVLSLKTALCSTSECSSDGHVAAVLWRGSSTAAMLTCWCRQHDVLPLQHWSFRMEKPRSRSMKAFPFPVGLKGEGNRQNTHGGCTLVHPPLRWEKVEDCD